MKRSNIYINLWSKYLTSINSKLNFCSTKQFIQLSKNEFESVGDRKKSGYRFNLEFVDGIKSNNIKHTAVARDLAMVLLKDSTSKRILKTGHHKINMNKDFLLSIIKLT
jgi:hypothetical protein